MRTFLFAILALLALAMPNAVSAQSLVIRIAPPELPVYVQPAIPSYGYIWAPGYWAYGPDGYFWVPGTWVRPPSVGLLWTPGYWGWSDGVYRWNEGYWGPHIGFYGGVNYGFGYGGVGYEGGRWNNGVFAYNRTVNNFGSVSITSVYSQTVVTNTTVNRVSFNGGTGGTTVQPTPQELSVAHEQHIAATPLQTQHEQTASTNKMLLASVNHGSPAVAATSKPGEFSGKGVVSARVASPSATLPRTAPAAPSASAVGKKEPSGASHSTTSPIGAGSQANGAAPPKAMNNQTKPLADVTSPKPVSSPKMAAPKPPPPHPVVASRAPKPAGPPPRKKP